MTREEAMAKINEILRELNRDTKNITEDTDLRTNLWLLDLDMIEFQLMAEEKFSIQLTDEETDAIGDGITRLGNWVDRILAIRTQQHKQQKETEHANAKTVSSSQDERDS